MFEKREVRSFSGLRRDVVWAKSWDWWGRQGFHLTKTGPYRFHGSSYYSRIGLRRECELIVDDLADGCNVDLTLDAQIRDEGLIAGAVTAVLRLALALVGCA